MIAPATGIAAKTYISEMPMDGDRCVAMAGTSAAPCQTSMPANSATSAVTACRSVSRRGAGRRTTRLSTPRCAARPIARHAPRKDAHTNR
jgi:hypothetical protein